MDKRHAGSRPDNRQPIMDENDTGIGCLGISAQVCEFIFPPSLVQIRIFQKNVETERSQIVQCIYNRSPGQQLFGNFHTVGHIEPLC